MDRNAVPAKTKPPPKDSDEESESSEEETEDEEQAEGGSEMESESDESTDTTKKKLIGILPAKLQSAMKAAAAPGSPVKRTREANGRKEKEDEPPSKKKKPEVVTPAPKSASKPTAQQSDKKKESASKADKNKPATPAKDKPSKDAPVEKDTKKSSKKKAQSPAARADASKPSVSKNSEGETPQKAFKPSRPWLPEEEMALSREIQKDRVHEVYGTSLPSSRSDPYWEKLMNRLSFMEKYEKDQRVERLCEKVRRMRLRYESLLTRIKTGETNVWKNDHEGFLWRIWHTIWGPNKATPSMLNEADEDDDDDDDDDEDDEEDDEDEEEDEIQPTQAKGRASTAPKKQINKKKAESSSEDEESNKEETPVKAAAAAAPPVAAPAVVAGTKPSTPKSVPAKSPAPTPMEADLNTPGKDLTQQVAVHNGVQGDHAGTPALAEQSTRLSALPKVVLSDELRAENLAFLRDMRGTCVKMVEEARTQSLLISERMLEETRAKTTQIVEEAREKSSQILEELRLVAERLGTIAGQNGRVSSPGIGSWSDFSENTFLGRSLLGNGVPMGDQSQLEGKWREQSEAEQGLILQRLQLVQESARIQQEGIRLKINLQKQQALSQDKA